LKYCDRNCTMGASTQSWWWHSGVSSHRDTNDRLPGDNYKRSLKWSATWTLDTPARLQSKTRRRRRRVIHHSPVKCAYSVYLQLPSKRLWFTCYICTREVKLLKKSPLN